MNEWLDWFEEEHEVLEPGQLPDCEQLISLIENHYPKEWYIDDIECACSIIFTEPKLWAKHLAERLMNR